MDRLWYQNSFWPPIENDVIPCLPLMLPTEIFPPAGNGPLPRCFSDQAVFVYFMADFGCANKGNRKTKLEPVCRVMEGHFTCIR